MTEPNFRQLVLQASRNVALENPDTDDNFNFANVGPFSLKTSGITQKLREMLGDNFLPTLKKEISPRKLSMLTINDLYKSIIQPEIDIQYQRELTKTVIYRFADRSELVLRPGKIIKLTRLAYDLGLLTHRQMTFLPKPPHYCFYYIPASLNLVSSDKNQIGLREYLDVGKGVGGQITGFQQYNPGELEVSRDRLGDIGTVYGAYGAFRWGNRPLFVTTAPIASDFTTSGLKLQYVNITGQYPKFEGGESTVQLSGNLDYVPGVVKYFNAGSAMPEPNSSEINFVGNFSFPGFVIEIHRYHPETQMCDQATIEDPDLYAAALEVLVRI